MFSIDKRKKFTKQSKTPDELVDQLMARGLIVNDINLAKDFLSKVSYYRLSGYWFKFQNKWLKTISYDKSITEEEKDEINNRFVKSVSFQNIIDIYDFDSQLRNLVIEALERFEIAANTIICNYMCETKGGFWFLNKKNILTVYKGKSNKAISYNYKKFLNDITKTIDNNGGKKSISSFKRKYSNKYPPFWITSQFLTFGTLSKIYESLSAEEKKNIAKKFNVNTELFASNLQSLSYVRNICAHYSRLWDNESSINFRNIKLNLLEEKSAYNYNFNNSPTFFPVFYVLSFYLEGLFPNTNWCNLIKEKINEYQQKTIINGESLISFKKMGFPENWEQLPLFVKMIKNK